MDNTLVIIGEVVLVPVLTFLTMWVRNNSDKDLRRDKRDDGYILTLTERVTAVEQQLAARDKEISEIRVELKNRDEEYISLYKEHTTIRAKYEVLLADHTELKSKYTVTAVELENLKETFRQDRTNTAEVATNTAQTV